MIVITECRDHENSLLTSSTKLKVGDIDGKCPICETDSVVKEIRE